MVRGNEGGDPSSVIFDAVERASARNVDLVLADTAGRLHTKTNLMDELRKVRRVAVEGRRAGHRGAARHRRHHRPERPDPGQGVRRGHRHATATATAHRRRADQARRLGQGRHRVRHRDRAGHPRQARRPRRADRGPRRLRSQPSSSTRCSASRRHRSPMPMFDSLSDRLEAIVKRVRGKGRLTDDDVDEILREIRTALLEADVNVTVVRNVVGRIREQAIGAKLSQVLDPSQQVVKIVNAGAHRHARRRDPQDQLRQPAADGGADGRPAGLGQDHQHRQAGPLVQEPGSPAADGRRRPAAPRRRRAAAHARPPDRRAGVQRARRPGHHGPPRPRGGPPPRARTCSSSTPPAACRSTPS